MMFQIYSGLVVYMMFNPYMSKSQVLVMPSPADGGALRRRYVYHSFSRGTRLGLEIVESYIVSYNTLYARLSFVTILLQ